MAPSLEAYAQKNQNVALLRVEIANWESAVSKQYNLRGIPYFQIYDGSGKMTAEGDSARQMLGRMVK